MRNERNKKIFMSMTRKQKKHAKEKKGNKPEVRKEQTLRRRTRERNRRESGDEKVMLKMK